MDFGLKNINMLSKDAYDKIAEPARDELFVVSSSGFGFPSNNYDDLELGASGTQYTAPANGYFYIDKSTNGNGQYVVFYTPNSSLDGELAMIVYQSGQHCSMLYPALKGKNVIVSYNAGGTTNKFRFIYAEGE